MNACTVTVYLKRNIKKELFLEHFTHLFLTMVTFIRIVEGSTTGLAPPAPPISTEFKIFGVPYDLKVRRSCTSILPISIQERGSSIPQNHHISHMLSRMRM